MVSGKLITHPFLGLGLGLGRGGWVDSLPESRIDPLGKMLLSLW